MGTSVSHTDQPPWASQPLPAQITEPSRVMIGCPLLLLADVELQLCMQFLDKDSKLKAARCNRQLLHAADHPFAWRGEPVFVEACGAEQVERACTTLLRFAPIHLCCICLGPLSGVTAVPHLFGLELMNSPEGASAADLPQLLQHPNLARLQLLRLGVNEATFLTVDAMRLIARLPQLQTIDILLPRGEKSAALLQPLTDAPALTDLTVRRNRSAVNTELLTAINGCGGLRRLRFESLVFDRGNFAALCSSPNMRRLQHLELVDFIAAKSNLIFINIQPPDADEYRAAFSALEQLQSLTLEKAWGIHQSKSCALWPHCRSCAHWTCRCSPPQAQFCSRSSMHPHSPTSR
jgi:hypothetical protein